MMTMNPRSGLAIGLLAVSLAACTREPAPAPTAAADKAVDPVTAFPDAYKLEFENDYVKVVRVHYDVGEKLPEHIHPAGMTAYVYLNDNDGVLFDHFGSPERAYRRPPVRTGGARFQTSTEEHHTLENISPTPSDFIRVWYKTDQLDLGHAVRRRIARSEKEYKNKATRISRPAFEAGQPFNPAPSDHPSLIVAWPSGQHHWIEPKTSTSIPAGGSDTGFVRIEFLSSPRKPR
jgi:hypothetical protein